MYFDRDMWHSIEKMLKIKSPQIVATRVTYSNANLSIMPNSLIATNPASSKFCCNQCDQIARLFFQY